MTAILAIIGVVMIYSWIHTVILTFTKSFKERTSYEKVVTIVAIIMGALYIIGTI